MEKLETILMAMQAEVDAHAKRMKKICDEQVEEAESFAETIKKMCRMGLEELEGINVVEPKKLEPSPFERGQLVLVRDGIGMTWEVREFMEYNAGSPYPFVVFPGVSFRQCIELNEQTKGLIANNEDYE